MRKAENRAQKAPVVQLDQSVKIKELEAQLAQTSTDSQASVDLENQIREHQLTIDAYRAKLRSTKNELLTQSVQSPASSSEDITPAVADSASDDLKLIKGVGPKLEKVLNELGVYKFSQIAAWTQADIEKISQKLGSFKDRVTRDDWVNKARELDKMK